MAVLNLKLSLRKIYQELSLKINKKSLNQHNLNLNLTCRAKLKFIAKNKVLSLAMSRSPPKVNQTPSKMISTSESNRQSLFKLMSINPCSVSLTNKDRKRVPNLNKNLFTPCRQTIANPTLINHQ